MKIKHYHENPPTAGLPIRWHDWFARNKDLSKCIEALFNLPPLSITCSGTIALVVALKTLAKDNPNRKCVIIPAYTCPLVALAINHCGLKIILCDVAKNSFDFDFEKLALLLNDQVLAVIPTHLGGRIANVAAVKKLTISYNITIIEDAAQALGAEVGKEGDIIIFSLATGKGLTMYEGGLLTANTPELRQKIAETIRQIPRNIYWEIKRTIELAGYTALYNPLGLYFAYGIARRKALKKKI
ncbi:aminotransferase class I/II-fold pyridoxal phosphate-dependent enzyme [Orbus wheelerorum]|uniref:DegT/DnrJ/EryC1/StrS family aminotransferase n=1 Tax=Orbus wheelerorum TaxID=3074111 RepID=UPI00370D78DA